MGEIALEREVRRLGREGLPASYIARRLGVPEALVLEVLA